jgi:hypothetical protein
MSILYGPAYNRIHKYLVDLKININEEMMFDFLKVYRRWPLISHTGQPSIEMINNMGNKEKRQLMDYRGYLNFDAFKKYYDLGYAFILSDILDLHSELRAIDEFAKQNVGTRIAGNFYFTKGGGDQAPSLKIHTDAYDIFVKNIYGKSYWLIGKEKILSDNQQVHYVKPEVPHGVYEIPEKRLSLVLGCYGEEQNTK